MSREVKRVHSNLMWKVIDRVQAIGSEYPTDRVLTTYGLSSVKEEDVPMADAQTKSEAPAPTQPSAPSGVGQSSGSQQAAAYPKIYDEVQKETKGKRIAETTKFTVDLKAMAPHDLMQYSFTMGKVFSYRNGRSGQGVPYGCLRGV